MHLKVKDLVDGGVVIENPIKFKEPLVLSIVITLVRIIWVLFWEKTMTPDPEKETDISLEY